MRYKHDGKEEYEPRILVLTLIGIVILVLMLL